MITDKEHDILSVPMTADEFRHHLSGYVDEVSAELGKLKVDIMGGRMDDARVRGRRVKRAMTHFDWKLGECPRE